MGNRLAWKEKYSIGVPVVDKAHKRLFSIVGRLMRLVEEDAKDKHACIEGIKYFKSYAVKHFAEEEEYMRSIHYVGYEMHKQLHDNLREKTLPALEERMEDTDYSDESVNHFIGVCVAWLTEHIMIEDCAIAGKVTSKWNIDQEGEIMDRLEHGLIVVLRAIFDMKALVFNNHYAGEHVTRAVNHRLDYLTPEGKRLRIVMSVEEPLVLSALNKMGIECGRIDETVLSATVQMNKQVIRHLGRYFTADGDQYRLQEEALISMRGMKSMFAVRCPQYSILIDTGMGFFTFCADEMDEK